MIQYVRLPAMYQTGQFIEDGGLMGYGVNYADLYRRAAIYVDKITKGAKPADLPVELPMRFELLINLKAASNQRDDSAECTGARG